MVKPLHPIAEIAARIEEGAGEGVRLSREADAVIQTLKADDVAAAIVTALEEPLDYPPLAAGVVPGDRVAIAVDEELPCMGMVVHGAVEALRAAGVELSDITIVTPTAAVGDLCREGLAGIDPAPQVIVHDPSDDNSVCLVGTLKRGEPLLINRAIFDADLVLPIGCARIARDTAYAILYPRFSNAAALERARTPAEHDTKQNRGKRSEGDEAGWLIGVAMTVHVIPGPSETVAQVLAGEPQVVARQAGELCRNIWEFESPQRVSLVVATITGGAEAQTWANVGRALAAAEPILEEDGGAVAICSNLSESTGRSLGRLISSPDLDAAARKIYHDHDADTWTALQLVRALQRGPVYFMSQLENEAVEELGLAPVENVNDLVRLTGRAESFAVINDAQHAVVSLAGAGEGGES